MTHPAHQLHEVPHAPPPVVLAQVAAADATFERLHARGRRVHFDLHPQTGALEIHLVDGAGRAVAALSAHDVLEILAKGDID